VTLLSAIADLAMCLLLGCVLTLILASPWIAAHLIRGARQRRHRAAEAELRRLDRELQAETRRKFNEIIRHLDNDNSDH
jgi:beta-lactamase regulating signal transducer with metallopeptidase domain